METKFFVSKVLLNFVFFCSFESTFRTRNQVCFCDECWWRKSRNEQVHKIVVYLGLSGFQCKDRKNHLLIALSQKIFQFWGLSGRNQAHSYGLKWFRSSREVKIEAIFWPFECLRARSHMKKSLLKPIFTFGWLSIRKTMEKGHVVFWRGLDLNIHKKQRSWQRLACSAYQDFEITIKTGIFPLKSLLQVDFLRLKNLEKHQMVLLEKRKFGKRDETWQNKLFSFFGHWDSATQRTKLPNVKTRCSFQFGSFQRPGSLESSSGSF